jgi:hypothetical protein
MVVSSWPCNVLSEIHINGRRVSEPVHEDKGKTTAPESKDRKDPKRECVVLSKGLEVVGPGYSRVTGVAVKVTDKRENSGNHDLVNRVSKTEQHYPSRVNRVSQNSNTDRQADQVGQTTWDSPNSSMDQQTYQVSRVGNTEHKKRGSSRVANMEVWVIENSANTGAGLWKIRLTRKARLWKIQLTQKAGLWKIHLTRKTGLYRTRGARNRKKKKVLLQAKGQLHGGAQGVLPRHKNIDCKRCVKES